MKTIMSKEISLQLAFSDANDKFIERHNRCQMNYELNASNCHNGVCYYTLEIECVERDCEE